jgi:DNA polymerase-4
VISDTEERQMNLFGFEMDEKKEKLDQAIDKIRNRFGTTAIQRASLVKPKSDIKE